MSFKNAVEKTPHLEDAWQPGLQALRAEDKPHIHPQDTQRLRGSVDIDAALKKAEPNSNRWDFAIAYQHSNEPHEFLYWVELHTASDAQVKVVIRKAAWLLDWLRNGGKLLSSFNREIIWISSGATSFTRAAPQRRQMAQVGLVHRGSRLQIRNCRS